MEDWSQTGTDIRILERIQQEESGLLVGNADRNGILGRVLK